MKFLTAVLFVCALFLSGCEEFKQERKNEVQNFLGLRVGEKISLVDYMTLHRNLEDNHCMWLIQDLKERGVIVTRKEIYDVIWNHDLKVLIDSPPKSTATDVKNKK